MQRYESIKEGEYSTRTVVRDIRKRLNPNKCQELLGKFTAQVRECPLAFGIQMYYHSRLARFVEIYVQCQSSPYEFIEGD